MAIHKEGLKLTFLFESQLVTIGQIWSPDRKFWPLTFFLHNLHKNMILYVTLHSRKVTIEELKWLQTALLRILKLPLSSGGMSLVQRWWFSFKFSSKCFTANKIINYIKWSKAQNLYKSVIFIVRQCKLGSLFISLCYFFKMALLMSGIRLVPRVSFGSLARSTFSTFRTASSSSENWVTAIGFVACAAA